ncbi:hypothetical protein ABTK11_20105, partial [Acinetobacter baumannii]
GSQRGTGQGDGQQAGQEGLLHGRVPLWSGWKHCGVAKFLTARFFVSVVSIVSHHLSGHH